MSKPKKKLKCTGDPDIELFDRGLHIIGIDEAGRGPIAGPIFIGIVHFKKGAGLEKMGLKDSKKFTSEKKRREVEKKIIDDAWTCDVIEIPVSDIEEAVNINDLCDVYTAERILYPSLHSNSKVRILVDGNRKINGIPKDLQICRPKLDATSWHVAAASILAKTRQVRYMDKLHAHYPQYGFDRHHGYGTKEHFEAIKTFGLLKEHRASWIKPEKIT